MKNKTVSATLAALAAQVIFGFSFMFTKIALAFASPLTVIADRYIVAFISLTAVMLFTGTKISIGKNIWKLLLMSLFQPVLYYLFESYGIEMTTSAFSSVMISLIPVVSMISGVIFLKEIPSLLQYLFTALSVGGVIITALAGNADGTVTPLGVILLFGAVLSSVGYNTASRKISAEFTPLERTYAMTFIGLLTFVSVALLENAGNPQEVFVHFMNYRYMMSVLYLGILSSTVAFILLNFANTYLPVSKTTVFSNITTVVSVIAGSVFLNERMTYVSVLATVMIIVGVWGVQRLDVKKKE